MSETRRQFLFMLLAGAIVGALATAVAHDYWVKPNAITSAPSGRWKDRA